MKKYEITITDFGKYPELVSDVLARVEATGAVSAYNVIKLVDQSTAEFLLDNEEPALMPVVELLSAAGAEVRVTESEFAVADNIERVFSPRQDTSSKVVEQSAAWTDLAIIAEQKNSDGVDNK